MGAAAATGGGPSGPLAAAAGYPALGWIGAAIAVLLLGTAGAARWRSSSAAPRRQ